MADVLYSIISIIFLWPIIVIEYIYDNSSYYGDWTFLGLVCEILWGVFLIALIISLTIKAIF